MSVGIPYWEETRKRREAFIEVHGTAAQRDHTLYFADGASCEVRLEGNYFGPPKDEFQRLKLIATHHEIMLNAATATFLQLKQQLAAKAENCALAKPGFTQQAPTDAEYAELKRLQAVVKKCQKALAKAQQERDAKDERLRCRRLEEESAARTREQASEAFRKLNEIRI